MATTKNDQQELVTEFAVMRVQMSTIETTLGDVSRELENVARDLARRNETPWNNIIAACGVSITFLSIIGWLALGPVQTTQARLVEVVDRMQVSMVPRVENEQHWTDYERRHAELIEVLKELRTDNRNATAATIDRLSKRSLYYESLSNQRQNNNKSTAPNE